LKKKIFALQILHSPTLCCARFRVRTLVQHAGARLPTRGSQHRCQLQALQANLPVQQHVRQGQELLQLLLHMYRLKISLPDWQVCYIITRNSLSFSQFNLFIVTRNSAKVFLSIEQQRSFDKASFKIYHSICAGADIPEARYLAAGAAAHDGALAAASSATDTMHRHGLPCIQINRL
jgi:hypothetical protein